MLQILKLNQAPILIDPWRIWSQKYLHDEINFLIDTFVENGNDRNHMLAIINEKGNRRNETNDESNYKNMLNYCGYQSLGQK